MADFSITGDVRLNSDPAEQSVNKWTVAAGQMIADFAKKAADALLSVVKSGLSYNRDMESYLTNFKVMLGDEQLAAEKLEEIRKMAASTPFTLSDLTEGTQTLLQFGIAADDTTNVLQMLGDISLGNADKMQTLVRAYGKMSSAQKVTLENVNMMIDAGFNPLNQICEATGESMSDLYKRISAGKVGFEELQAAVEAATSEGGQFYNGMLEASQTFNGRLSTLQDNVAALTGKLTDGLFSALGDLIVKTNELVVSITEDDQKLAKLKDTIGLVITVVTSAGVAFLTYKGYLTATSAATVVQTAATTALAAAHKAAEGGATGLAVAQAALNAVMKANTVGIAVSVVAALAAALVTAYQTSETFRNIVNGAFQAVANIAKSAIGAAIGWLDKLSYKLNSFLGKDGYTGFSSYDDYKADKDAQAAAATSKANREARHKAAQAGQGISTKSWTELQEEAKAAQKTTEQAASAVSASSKKASSSAKKAASEVVNSITSTSTQIENGVTRTTETVHETLKNGTKQQKQTVTETSRQMVDGVLSDVKTITTTAADGSQKVTQSIEAVRDVVSTTKDTQTALVDGVKTTTETTTKLLADGSEQVEQTITATGTEIIDGVQRTVKTVTTIAADGTQTVAKTIEDAGPQYGSMGELKFAFKRFALMTQFMIFANADDKNTMDVMYTLDRRVRTFGINNDGDYQAVNVQEYKPGFFEFDLKEWSKVTGHIRLAVPGRHNIYNALAMCAVCRFVGLTVEQCAAAAASFKGAGRRFEVYGECNGAVVVDDYAHHPTELRATLTTAKELGYKRLIAVHQPFTYSRTKMLMDDFAKVLRAADQVVLLPIMGGREKDDGSVRSEDLAAKLPGSVVVDGLEGAAAWVRQNAKKGDLVVCMSCGDLYKAADMMVEK